MDDWGKIRQLFSAGQHSKREIGRLVGVSRGTVDRALESDRLSKYQRAATGSSFDAYATQVRVLLAVTPRMPASTLAERVGWLGSASVFRDKVALIRPEYVPPDAADRLVHEPGRQVQCDLWFPHEPLPLSHGQEGMPPVLVMTSTFSDFFQAIMLPSRTTSDLLGGIWSLLQAAGAVPLRLTWDNETGIGKGKLTERTAAFAGTLGTEIKLLKARDPESKGMVERRNRFFRSSFMPGRHFASPQDFNEQIADWLPLANARHSRSRRARPIDLIEQDRAAMRPLSPVPPDVLFHNTVRLPRDYYVRVLSNDHSVAPAMIGRLVDVTASLDTINVTHNGMNVSSHEREWARALTVTDPEHVGQADVLRRQFQSLRHHRPQPTVAFVETASLASYDRLFGVETGTELRDLDVVA
ncbi:IS21 family transposase [Cryobacterium lyxosi]|uniref:IS21 family transposase n=1 Tax=Cryobacterium lyxosi TaxID=1259228 RepID=A0A4R8ZBK4_9MICO|nr:IS21 family transposase [Cryobacterium lyxosi]TFD24076.1 IS21 family transposase [Cryobacterium lyxosi]